MATSPVPLQQLFRKFLFFQFLILVALVGLSMSFSGHFQDRLARQLAETLREPIIAGDIRFATLQMAGSVSQDFRGATWKSATAETSFSVPVHLDAPNAMLHRVSIVPIYFDEQKSRLAGNLFFYYPRWASLPIAIAIWMMLLIVSIPIVRYENARLSREYELMLRLELKDSHAALATQVAHDIRSPLAALEVAAGDVSQLPEDKRILIRSAVGRIRDIANSLLNKNRATPSETTPPGDAGISLSAKEVASPQLLSSLIESLVTEKRLQFRSRSRVEIESWLDASSYGIFAQVQPIEFKRLLSNLVNNAVEAFADGPGAVRVNLSARDGRAMVSVQDNGKGIPPEVLAKLGHRGETYGKAGGSGLGLYHARTSAESWGGSLEITSKVGKGATMTVLLPLAPAPEWFVPELRLSPDQVVVILDDDASIHQVWQGRLDALKAGERGVEVVHVSAPDEIRSWVKSAAAKALGALYLFDYELLGYRETGLSLAEELALGQRVVLVTSRYEEPVVLEGCRKLKTRLIPKGLAGSVPMRVEAGPPADASQRERLDAVLIDDDPLTRMTWKMTASRLGKKLRAFATAAEFFEAAGEIDRATPVYMDAELGDGVLGAEESRRAHGLGFGEVFLATGHEPEKFAGLAHLRGVIGKEPPWGREG